MVAVVGAEKSLGTAGGHPFFQLPERAGALFLLFQALFQFLTGLMDGLGQQGLKPRLAIMRIKLDPQELFQQYARPFCPAVALPKHKLPFQLQGGSLQFALVQVAHFLQRIVKYAGFCCNRGFFLGSSPDAAQDLAFQSGANFHFQRKKARGGFQAELAGLVVVEQIT